MGRVQKPSNRDSKLAAKDREASNKTSNRTSNKVNKARAIDSEAKPMDQQEDRIEVILPESSPTSTSRDPRSQGAGKLAVPAQQGTFWDAHSSSRSGGECRGSGSRSRELHKSESKSTASESRGQKFGGSATAAQDKPRDMKGRSTELPKSKSSSSSSSKEKPLGLRSGGGAVAPSKDREVQSRSSAQIPPTRGLESRPKTAALPKVWSQAGKGGVDGGRHVDSKTKVKSGRW
ncbi:hypothetical protein BKA65DRAFT_564427 [Rhexocercosporidium sp. MPI-PUGE-AT-0058]|nr:hypothetical protein BKA65DRAFT_564427 [Rhexocercosporidium sp. MPI-PUGE-AT-0058]